MTATGRLLLYVITGVDGPVRATKQLFVSHDIQHNEGLDAANAEVDFSCENSKSLLIITRITSE